MCLDGSSAAYHKPKNAELCFALVLDLHTASLMTQEFFSYSRLFFRRKPILLRSYIFALTRMSKRK